MHNPLQGIVSSEHEIDGGYKNHWGRDIAPRPRVSGAPVYAMFGGVLRNVVRWSVPGNRRWTWADYATGNGFIIANPDGEGQGYNHVMLIKGLNEGNHVQEGQLIGHLDSSGNQTAQHLHIETWANWKNRYTHYSPKILFDKYKISTTANPAPSPKPSKPAKVTAPAVIIAPTPKPELQPEPTTTPFPQEETMLFIWGRSRGRILSGGVFAGVPHSLIVNAQKVGIPVIALTDEAHESLINSFADRVQKAELVNEKDV